MRLVYVLLCIAFVTLTGACAVSAEKKPELEPFQLVRSLQFVQDAVAQGNSAAFEAQRKLLGVIADRFAAFEPTVWQKPRNARAALLLSMSGGSPTVLKTLVEAKLLPAKEAAIAKAVVAFAEGRRRRAWYYLSKIDARKVHPVLAGHIALIKGGLIAPSRPADAYQQFNDARLLAPGTLVEEAALRRQVLLTNTAGHSDALNNLTKQYIRRFARSPYLNRFLSVYSDAVVGRFEASQSAQFDDVARVLEMLPSRQRHRVLLDIARLSLARGELSLAAQSATALAEAKDNPGEAARRRAELYRAAAQIVTDGYEESLDTITGIDRKTLSRQDAELHESATILGHAIREKTDEARAAEVSEEEMQMSKGQMDDVVRSSIEGAQNAISGVDALLWGTS